MIKKIKQKITKMIKGIVKRMLKKEINPLEATLEVDSTSGGVEGVTYRKGFTVQTKGRRDSVNTRGLSKKEIKIMQEFAALLYHQAQQNGEMRPGEVHLGKGLSSKHYAGGLRDYTNSLLLAYSTA